MSIPFQKPADAELHMKPRYFRFNQIPLTAVAIAMALGGVDGFAADPTIHLAWDEPGTPAANIDYFVKVEAPASPEFPDVQLETGSLTWRIWSTDPDNPDGLGDIGVISSPAAQNFGVSVATPLDELGNAHPGARTVRAITLVPTSSGNHSNIPNAWMLGDLLEDVVVQPDASGNGGEAELHIAGNVTADMTLHKVIGLTIGGEASGNITIHELAQSSTIVRLAGTVSVETATGDSGMRVFEPMSGSFTVSEIQDGRFTLFFPSGITQTGFVSFGDMSGSDHEMDFGSSPGDGQLAGTLQFLGGVNDASIRVHNELTATGVIDLNGVGVSAVGELLLRGGGAGSVINGGTVSGIVTLGKEQFEPDTHFTGQATFVDATVSASVEIFGAGSLVFSGTFDGNICGNALAPGEPLPPNIQIAQFGPCARICGVWVDGGSVQPEWGNTPRNRYLSLSLPSATSALRAIHVRSVELQDPQPPNAPQFPPPDFSAFEAAICSATGESAGCARWVGPPRAPGSFVTIHVPRGTSLSHTLRGPGWGREAQEPGCHRYRNRGGGGKALGTWRLSRFTFTGGGGDWA